MSLINQMLRDLDQRQASALERQGLAMQVRALPREKRFPWAGVLTIIAAMAAAAVAAFWLTLDKSAPVAPVPAPAPAVAMAMPTLIVPMPAEAAPEPAAAEHAPPASGLQMDYEISQPSRHADAAPAASPLAAPTAVPAPIESPAPARIVKRPLAQPAETADGEYRKALALYRQGRGEEAAAGFRAALRLDARHTAARQALLSQLLGQKQLAEAQATAAEGLALDPSQAGWAMILARLQVEQGQIGEAERTMSAHETYGERNADYLAFHGLLLDNLNRPQEARSEYQKAHDLGTLPPEMAAAVEQRLR